MNMMEWAKKEVEIACRHENPERKEGEFDYGCACYESALKALESLLSDDHSGASIEFAKNILNRLINWEPLTPIEDTDDIWNLVEDTDAYSMCQCKRMSDLFKYEYANGAVKYCNMDSCYCVDIRNPDVPYRNSFIRNIIEEMFPITMPYMPGKPIKVYCEDFLTDRKNGDFDTLGILTAIKPDGEIITIARYFKESDDDWKEIDLVEYEGRRRLAGL